MKNIIFILVICCSFSLSAQDSGETFESLGEKLGVGGDCQKLKELIDKNTDYKTKYGDTYLKNAKAAFSAWKIQAQRYLDSNLCSPEDYIMLSLRLQKAEERFLNCLSIHQLQLGLDAANVEHKKLIDEINDATISWSCKKEDYHRLKPLVDKVKQ
jgi:hypothetical protein